MKNMENTIAFKNIRFIAILTIAAILLSVPAIAMQFTGEVKWNLFDFVVAGVLLFGTGLLCELALRLIQGLIPRAITLGLILLGLFLVWAELAVGIFGTRFAGS